jgi:catechol 2,3-dioxygenase-like lactoylglutathione lyase family enzyme
MLAIRRSEEESAMINGAHVVVYSKDPESDRAFFRDVLKFPAVDAGHGWLIFALPSAETAFHPGEKNDVHQLHFTCDDLQATMESLKAEKVKCGPVQEEQWGSLTTVSLPGGGKIGLYKPKHPTAAWPPLPSPKDEWKLKANANYQEVMKTLMTLVTASLVLPIWFIRNFVSVPQDKPIRAYLQGRPWAYRSWVFLSCSLLFGMLFYLASSKFVKAVCGGYANTKKVWASDPEWFWEKVRDDSGFLMGVLFIIGLVAALLFFKQP